MIDVYVTETILGGQWLYQVWVDGKVFKHFYSDSALTWSQQDEVATGFREAFN